MNPSDQSVLDEFGKLLIEHVRDKTIQEQQGIISGKMARYEDIYGAIDGLKLEPQQFEVIGRLLMDAIERTVGNFLSFFDENNYGMIFRDEEGREHDIQAMSDGLVGELYTEDGWIARFSSFNEGASIEKLK
jgi:hypothetical protein